MRLTEFRVLTFDCYGTLIDWESGIFTALQPLLRKAAAPLSRDAALELFARHESAQEAETPTMLYSDVLTAVHRRLADTLGLSTSDEEDRRFGASVPDWPAFADSASSLQYLKKYYQLVILSNVDRKSFEGSNKRLGVEFDAIYTAQDVGSYKPDSANFTAGSPAAARAGAGGHPAHGAEPVPRPRPGQAGQSHLRLDRSPARAGGVGCHHAAPRRQRVRLPLHQYGGHGESASG
jgi:2-haloacid dehalogenase